MARTRRSSKKIIAQGKPRVKRKPASRSQSAEIKRLRKQLEKERQARVHERLKRIRIENKYKREINRIEAELESTKAQIRFERQRAEAAEKQAEIAEKQAATAQQTLDLLSEYIQRGPPEPEPKTIYERLDESRKRGTLQVDVFDIADDFDLTLGDVYDIYHEM